MLSLFIDVPMAAFRPRWAREYQESYPVPPPATLFGMLLSLVGVEREDKAKFAGIELAIAVSESSWENGAPVRGRVFRKFRRVGQSAKNPDPLADRRPDYQELILWLSLWLWLREPANDNVESLVDKVKQALNPERRNEIVRHGALCLGESSHLINDIHQAVPDGEGRFLVCNKKGFLTMPVWVDHRQDKSRLETFSLCPPQQLSSEPPENEHCWITISP